MAVWPGLPCGTAAALLAPLHRVVNPCYSWVSLAPNPRLFLMRADDAAFSPSLTRPHLPCYAGAGCCRAALGHPQAVGGGVMVGSWLAYSGQTTPTES